MLWNAKNGVVAVGDTDMDYVSFGYGDKAMIFLPGLSDGLKTVKGKALFLAGYYRIFFEEYTVYMLSRKNDLPEVYSIREMADDAAEAMKALGINKAVVTGASQGGMVAQYLAINYPEMVEKLVIVVSAPRVNDTIRECVNRWIDYAERGDHKELTIDTIEKSYSPKALEKLRKTYPFIGLLGKPASYKRYLINAKAIRSFDAYRELKKINCPTLIIGGGEDQIVGIEGSYELHEQISDSELYVYEELGHAVYEEAEDLNERIFRFLEEKE